MQGLAVADREGGRQVGGYLVQEGVREDVAEHDARSRGANAEDGCLKDQQHDDLAPVIALHAQVRDEASSLGHGQQHRVERQQEADHHADRGEQLCRLVVRLDCLLEQAQFVIGGQYVQVSAGEPAQPTRHEAIIAAPGLDQNLRDKTSHPGQRLSARQRRDGDGARRQHPEG